MLAIEISEYGAPEVLRVVERDKPVPGNGELLIRVTASGVNRPDVLQRKGAYPAPVRSLLVASRWKRLSICL